MYHVIRKDRDRHGGGVVIYIKNTLDFQIIEHESLCVLEAICLKIHTKGSRSILFMNWYRNPNAKMEVWNNYERFLEFADSLNVNIIIMGDINCDILKNSRNALSDRYLGINCIYSLDQVNTRVPTRITHDSATLLDHMITNNINNVKSHGVIHVGMSDHSLSFLVWKTSQGNEHSRIIRYRNVSKVVNEDNLGNVLKVILILMKR